MKEELTKNMDYYNNVYKYKKIVWQEQILINKFKLYDKFQNINYIHKK